MDEQNTINSSKAEKAKEAAAKSKAAISKVSGVATSVAKAIGNEAKEHITIDNVKAELPDRNAISGLGVITILLVLGIAVYIYPSLLIYAAAIFLGGVYLKSKMKVEDKKKAPAKPSKAAKSAATQESQPVTEEEKQGE